MGEAVRLANRSGADPAVIEADILDRDEICSNPLDRCYHCKKVIFQAVHACMDRDGRDVLIDGTNASDDPVGHLGFRALAELSVVSPLARGGH